MPFQIYWKCSEIVAHWTRFNSAKYPIHENHITALKTYLQEKIHRDNLNNVIIKSINHNWTIARNKSDVKYDHNDANFTKQAACFSRRSCCYTRKTTIHDMLITKLNIIIASRIATTESTPKLMLFAQRCFVTEFCKQRSMHTLLKSFNKTTYKQYKNERPVSITRQARRSFMQ